MKGMPVLPQDWSIGSNNLINCIVKIKTYVINLEKSVERREKVLTELAKYDCLDVELVKAVDGRALSKEDTDRLFDRGRFKRRYHLCSPKPGEIGCTLSHRECYKRLLESDEAYALILEDDVEFHNPQKIEAVLHSLMSYLTGKDPMVITFTVHSLYNKKKSFNIDGYVFHKVYLAFGTCAYLINRKAARKMLSPVRASILADDYIYMNNRGISVYGIYPTFASGASEMKKIPSEVSAGQHVSIVRRCLAYFSIIVRIPKIIFLFGTGKLGKRKRVNGINL